MIVEILIKDRVGNFQRGEVVQIDSESMLFKALINGNKADIVNPPDWSPYTKIEIKEEADGESHSEQGSDGESVTEDSVSPKQSQRKGKESTTKSSGTSSPGYGGLSEIFESSDID